MHQKRCEKIRRQLEGSLGYSTEEALAKCRKKRGEKEDDVGEDAMALAVRGRREKKKAQNDQKELLNEGRRSKGKPRVHRKTKKENGMDGQISL